MKSVIPSLMLMTALIAGVIIPSSSYAEVYRSEDSQGNAYYGDQPLSDDAKSIPITAGPTPENTPTKAVTEETTPAAPNPVEEQQTQEADSCKQYEDNLAMLKDTSKRLYVNDENNNPHYLTDEERQQQIESTERKITAFCAPTDGEKEK